jgi:hypothetical protein
MKKLLKHTYSSKYSDDLLLRGKVLFEESKTGSNDGRSLGMDRKLGPIRDNNLGVISKRDG